MTIELQGDLALLSRRQNGDRMATFYHCKQCGQMLAVGCVIDGTLRGAVNGMVLQRKSELGVVVPIQPRLLSASEKLARWNTLWGRLIGV